VTDAAALVALANAGRARRPARARRAVGVDPFEHPESATEMLGGFLGRSVAAGELDDVRDLAGEAGQIADRLVDGDAPSLDALNRFAAGCVGHPVLRAGSAGALEAVTVWEPGPAAAVLARRIIEELGGIEPGRLRCCARPECDLIFYDTSRSGTQRWHSEDPCGWRERQRRRRKGRAAGG
jgi:hypothetical protein